MECLFCKIINNEIPSYTIYEDEVVKVFLDINPDSLGHTLIIPKKHFTDINDINDETLYHIQDISKKMAELLKEKLDYAGLTLTQNNGIAQVIKHYHLHLIPKYKKEDNITVKEVYEKIITTK